MAGLGFRHDARGRDALLTDGITIAEAIRRFKSSMEELGWGDGYQGHFKVLLDRRPKPRAEKHKSVYLESLSDLEVVEAFVHSWRNLNPTRNREKKGMKFEDRRLGINTRKAELTRFRYFMATALRLGWITNNPTPGIRIGKKKKRVAEEDDGHDSRHQMGEERYGLSPVEYERVEEQAHLWREGGRARQLQVIVPFLKTSGLRVSDAATLDLSEIVPRQSGSGHAIHLLMMKTGTWVYVPTPEDVTKTSSVSRCREKGIVRSTCSGVEKGKRHEVSLLPFPSLRTPGFLLYHVRAQLPDFDMANDPAAIGASALCENVRSVRLRFSTLDRRAADSRTAHAAIRLRSIECHFAGAGPAWAKPISR